MLRRESVRDSCSVRLWVRSFSVVLVMASEEVVWAVSVGWIAPEAWRARSSAGKSWSRSEGVGIGGSSGCVGEVSSSSVTCSGGVSCSTSSDAEGVSSPSKSSPSEDSLPLSVPNCNILAWIWRVVEVAAYLL
jgi:hypothetical protein